MKHIKSFKMVSEDPDYVDLGGGKYAMAGRSDNEDAVKNGRPFAFDRESKKIYLGGEGNYHGDDYGTSGAYNVRYPGRLWEEGKLISFWVYPKPDEFWEYIGIIEDELGYKIRDWQIEVMIKDDGEFVDVDDNYGDDYMKGAYGDYKVIPIEDFAGSEDVPEERRRLHMMNAKEKEEYYKKHGKPKGFGSSHKDYKPVEWRHAIGKWRGESKNYEKDMKYLKTFENFSPEEDLSPENLEIYNRLPEYHQERIRKIISNQKLLKRRRKEKGRKYYGANWDR